MHTSGNRIEGFISNYNLIMTGAVLCLGFMPIFQKQAVDTGSNMFAIALGMNLSTLCVLLVPGWYRRPPRPGESLGLLVLIGVLASGFVVILNIWALQTTTATHRSVFQAMYPAATALCAYWVAGERLPWRAYGVIAFMMAGLLVMAAQGVSLNIMTGDALLFLTLPMIGLSDAWVKRGLVKLTPEWIALGRFFFGTLVLLIAMLAVGDNAYEALLDAWLPVLAAGILIGLGIILLYRGIALKGAALSVSLVSAAPIVTVLTELFWLDRPPTRWDITGLVMVVMGAVLLSQRWIHRS